MSRFSTRITVTVTLAATALLAGQAHGQQHAQAQPPPPPPAGSYYTPAATAPADAIIRTGWNFGGGVGGGNMSCDGECDGVTEAGSVDLHVGNMLRPRLRVLGEVWAMFHTEDRFTLSQTIVTGGLQYWIMNRLWLKGGVGFASATLRYDGVFVDAKDSTENVPAVAGAIGFEALSRPHYALDVALRGGTGFYEQGTATNSAITVDFTWY